MMCLQSNRETFEVEQLSLWKESTPQPLNVLVPKLHFVTFADSKYAKTLARIEHEAVNTHAFSHVHTFSENDLGNQFWDKHRSFVESHSRGFGYWIWKPWVVMKTLEKAADGDVIVYADGGCGINTTGISNLIRYCSILTGSQDHHILGFQMSYVEHHWTKMDLFQRLNCRTDAVMKSGQVMATAFLCKKTPDTLRFMQAWYDMCSENNYHYVDDSPSVAPETAEFQEHRHDQSIFSLLCKTMGSAVLGDEVQTNDPAFPIKALRHKF